LPMHTARIPPVDPAPATITVMFATHAGHICPSSEPLIRPRPICFRSCRRTCMGLLIQSRKLARIHFSSMRVHTLWLGRAHVQAKGIKRADRGGWVPLDPTKTFAWRVPLPAPAWAYT